MDTQGTETEPDETLKNRADRRGHDADRLVTAAELAEHWGVSRAHIYNQLGCGLPSRKLGRSRRFHLAEVDAWAAADHTAA